MDIATLLPALALGVIASVLGGAIGGVLVGGRQIGNEIAAMMGSFYGPLAGFGGVLLGLAVVALLRA